MKTPLSFLMHMRSRLVLAAFVMMVTLVSVDAATNTTDLQAFRGRGTGSAKVTVSTSSYYGKSKIQVAVPTTTSAKIKINASVKSGSNTVAVKNELTFASSGVFRGKELAPGVTSGTSFKGRFTATDRVITFKGKFNVNSVKGTFSGTATKMLSGKLKVTYSLFIGDNTDPTYVYTYVGK